MALAAAMALIVILDAVLHLTVAACSSSWHWGVAQ